MDGPKQKGFLEESLAASQGKDVCRILFDESPDAIFLADAETGVILDANPAAAELTGRPVKELIGMHQSALHPPEKEEFSRRFFSDHAHSDWNVAPAKPKEYAIVRPDGTEVPVEIAGRPLVIKGRKVVQGFFRDISDRKNAQTALRESEELYRTLVDHAPVGIIVHRFGVIKFVNRKIAEIGGIRDASSLIGKSIMEFIHPDYRALVKERTELLMSRGSPLPPIEEKLLALDGSVFDMEMHSIRITYQGEDCIMSLVQDITDRNRAQEALRESEERYRTLVDHAQVGIVVHSLGVMKFVNQKMAEIVRVPSPEQVVGRNVLEFMHPDYREFVKERIKLSMASGTPQPPAEEKLVAADGTVLDVEILTIPITYLGERCAMAIVQDISARKKAEQQLLDVNAELERRVGERTAQLEELNKELEAFSYSAAHDMKAPLRRVNIFSDMLEKEAGPDLKDAARGYLNNIHKSVTQMTMLVEGLLTLSTTGKKPLDLAAVPLSALLKEALAEIKSENPGRAIEWSAAELPEVKCDRAMLKQVFLNLLGNAAKYTRDRNPARIEVLYSRNGGEHVIAVRDNGVGFSMEYSDKLFGVFQRLHKTEEFEGTGIGLSTVKRIVTRHGGRVWAEGSPDKGAAFYFTLPAASA